MMLNLGMRIRELREAHNMSQVALGKRVGRSKPVISSYENNLKIPPLDVLIKMANVFHISLDFLVGIEQKETVSLDGLTPSQIDVVKRVVGEFKNCREHRDK